MEKNRGDSWELQGLRRKQEQGCHQSLERALMNVDFLIALLLEESANLGFQ